MTIPLWTKAFKTLGIFNENYHEKYRKHLHNERYETYINLVIEDIKDDFYRKLKKRTDNSVDNM